MNYYCETTYLYGECVIQFLSLKILAKYVRRGRVIHPAVYLASKKFFRGFSHGIFHILMQARFISRHVLKFRGGYTPSIKDFSTSYRSKCSFSVEGQPSYS
jgi:hypothetical protein